ncbi:MAG: hypothetical protein R3C52_07075 [Hyphomonadaceae bacterium]
MTTMSMLKMTAAAGVAALMAAGCASSPEPGGAGGTATAGGSPAGGAVTTPTMMNIAATSGWKAEERLLPQQPILALTPDGGSVETPAGLAVTCNPDNGSLYGKLFNQPANRVGQSATYRLRMGAQALPLPGKFVAAAQGSAFEFEWDSVGLRTMAQLDMASFASDKGDVEWAFVRDPAAKVNAKYIGSLKDMAAESQNFLIYCNPK